MSVDKKRLYLISASALAVLLIAMFIPGEHSARVISAVLMMALAAISFFVIKKRQIPSINTREVTVIVIIIAVVLLMLLYLTGILFGFVKNPYADVNMLLSHFLPSLAIIVASEVYRLVIRSQDDIYADVLGYLSCVVAETLMLGNVYYVISFNRFMDFMALTLFPAVISNLLYHYLAKRYGMWPNIAYRLITTLYIYIIPIKSAISDSLLAFARLFIPILIFLFIDFLYEKKVRYALAKKSKLAVPITILAVAILTFTVMVVSNQFYIGAHVIATESMTGELNKGDVAIHEKYTDQTIEEGQVIVFEKDDLVVIHRVVDIQIINGQTRYFTKGDANDSTDAGFIYDSNIIGLVSWKLPYLGYPTLWMRSLFTR